MSDDEVICLDDDGLQAFKASLEDGKPRVVSTTWVPHSARRRATEEADQRRGRRMVDAVCGGCPATKKGRRRPIAIVVETLHGALYCADIYAPEMTTAAKDLASARGHEGRVPPAEELVRVLVEWTGPASSSDDTELIAQCSQHGRARTTAAPSSLLRSLTAKRRAG